MNLKMAQLEVSLVNPHQVASIVRDCIEKVLVFDSRSFLEYNTCHILHSVNICCSKLVKRRLEQNKTTVKELLVHSCRLQIDESYHIIVYDQSTHDVASISPDSFLWVFIKKLKESYKNVHILEGGFLIFQALHPSLCEDKTRNCSLTATSQPCLLQSGPTKILPFLYLGSQSDSADKEILKAHNITYELNVSNNCPKSEHIQDNHFLRIPVNDNYCEKLLPHFNSAIAFLDRVQKSNGSVLVHCLAGISRSPSIAIAYVMRHLRLTSDEAYRYVKDKRASISPNFNFLGQLQEFEKMLKCDNILAEKPEAISAPIKYLNLKRFCPESTKLSLDVIEAGKRTCFNNTDLSPTTALAKLSFYSTSPLELYSKQRSVSCFEGILPNCEDSKVEWSASDIRKTLYPTNGFSNTEKSEKRVSFENSQAASGEECLSNLELLNPFLKLERNLSSCTSGVGSETLEPSIQEDVMEESVFEETMDHGLNLKPKQGSLFLNLGTDTFLEKISFNMESPPSPSERHLLEEIEELPLNSKTVSSPVKESVDSGILLSPTHLREEINSALYAGGLYRAHSCPVMVNCFQSEEVKLRKTSLRASVDQLRSSSRPVSLIQVS